MIAYCLSHNITVMCRVCAYKVFIYSIGVLLKIMHDKVRKGLYVLYDRKLTHHAVIFMFEKMAVIHIWYSHISVVGHFYLYFDTFACWYENSVLVTVFIGRDICVAVSVNQSEMCRMNMKIVRYIHVVCYRPLFETMKRYRFIDTIQIH